MPVSAPQFSAMLLEEHGWAGGVGAWGGGQGAVEVEKDVGGGEWRGGEKGRKGENGESTGGIEEKETE